MSDQDERARNREIAANEEKRKSVGAVRISTWAVVIAVVVVLIMLFQIWPWMRPK